MPSPIGHAIAGVACGWMIAGVPRRDWRQRTREAALFGVLGAAPDLDLLFNAHSGPTHSLGAAVIVGVLALAVARAGRSRWLPVGMSGPGAFAFACCVAYVSHVLLDWLARDSTPPIGVMALWPLRREHYESDLHIFMAISRRYHQGWTFVRQNALALVRELMILLPCLTLVMALRIRRDP